MNWEAIATIAEVVGALGVIASLLYVGVQVRHNSEATRAATTAQTLDQSALTSQFLAQDKVSSNLYFRGLKDPLLLEQDEKSQYFFIMLSMFRRYENTEYQYRKGLFDEGAWEGMRGNIVTIIERPGFEWFWERAKQGYSPSFRKLLEGMKGNENARPNKVLNSDP